MATLLVAVLTIRAGLTRQRATADQQLRAAAAVDRLLADWWRDPASFPVDRAGPVPSDPTLTWSTRPLPNAAAARVGGRVVRVTVGPVAVDVVLPIPRGTP